MGGNTHTVVQAINNLITTVDTNNQSILSALGSEQNVAGPTKVTVNSTGGTLSTLGLTLNAETTELLITTPTEGIFWNYGAATTSSALLFVGINEVKGTLAKLNTLQFIVTSTSIDIFVEELT